MHTLIVSEGLSHMELWAQSQLLLGNTVGLYTTTPRFKLHRGMPKEVDYHFVPGPVQLLRGLTVNRLRIPRPMYDWDSTFFDKLTSRLIPESQLMLGPSSSSALTAAAAKRKGAKFVLDRACPDIRVQEAQSSEEAHKVGGTFNKAPDWFLQRQLDEYDLCDALVVPSEYTRKSYPPELQARTHILRLTGSVRTIADRIQPPKRPFTVGVVGGDPVRKGYLYLLEAWKQLGWNDARLLLRTNTKLMKRFPVLDKLIAEQPTVSEVRYVPDIADFYQSCDAFILPSIDDGFGLSLFEAAGQGIPCVVTTNCGASELLVNNEEALVIEPYSVEAIKTALTQLRESEELRDRLGRAALLKMKSLGNNFSESLYFKGVQETMARLFPA